MVGAIVWTLANIVYVDMRRKSVTGFGRFAAFWAGFPGNFVWMFVVEEGDRRYLEPPDDDEEKLLRDVIDDREARRLAPGGEAERKD
jgi:hypothetical protein